MRWACVTSLAIALTGLLVLPAAAQRGPVFCNVTEIKSEQLSNGVRVTIVTDGQVQWDLDFEQAIADGSLELKREHWGTYFTWSNAWRRIPLRLTNAKSMLGSGFVNVGKYPVSHVELSVPGWAKEGVGLEVIVVNYLGWRTGESLWQKYRYQPDLMQSDDGSSIIVTWTSDRFPPSPPPKTPGDLPSELEVTEREGLLDVSAVNAGLADLAHAISDKTGVPITCAGDSDLRVSAHLRRMEPAAAIQTIAAGLGLCVGGTPDGGWVLAQDVGTAAGYGASSSRTIPVRYLEAAEALDLFPNFLLGYMHADRSSNSLVVNGPEWMLDRVASDLAKLDRPAPQVSLEVTVVEYTSASALQRAIRADRFLGDWAAGLDTVSGELAFLWLGGLPRGWEAVLEGREAESGTWLRSRGTIQVLNGRIARIFAGQQRNIIVETIEDGRSVTVLPVEIGTSLEVRPRLGEGNEVLFWVHFEAQTQAGADPASGLPVIALRTGEAELRVRDGETVAVAGLTLSQESWQRRGIPVLRDIPLLGQFFEARERSRSETQLAVFLTPHLGSGGEQPARPGSPRSTGAEQGGLARG